MNVQPHSTDEPPFRARAIRAAIAAWLLVPLSFFVASTATWVFGMLARESLADGCQLEDYNADVARACADACTEPVTRAVLECIAREERAHADFSWALLAWLFASHENRVRPVLQEGLQRLERYQRPTAVSFDKRALVSRADPAALRAHGRLPDEEWAHLWTMRLSQTRTRINSWLLQGTPANTSQPSTCA